MASYTLVTPFTLAGPVLEEGTVLGDFSNTPTTYPTQIPASFGFLDPDLPRAVLHDFRGNEFFPQYGTGQNFDMAVESGGDTYEICGAQAFRKSDEVIQFRVAEGSYYERLRRDYAPFMVPGEEEEDPPVFSGYYTVDEVVLYFADDMPGVFVTQTRITGAERRTVWEFQGDATPGGAPKFSVIGNLVLSEEIDQSMLSEYAVQWQAQLGLSENEEVHDAMASAPASGFTYAFAYPLSQTLTGQRARISAGLAVVREIEVQADEPLEEGGPPEYTLSGVLVHYDYESRSNKPVVYEEGFGDCVGNDIYGNGFSRYQLTGLIEEKIWKDAYGIYDQEDPALDEVPWLESAQCAGFEIEGNGWLSRGIFTCADRGTYRVTLVDDDEIEVVQLEVEPGPGTEYFFPLVDDVEDSFIPVVGSVEKSDGEGGWILIDETGLVAARPAPGVRLLHARRQRRGIRWGHLEFEPQDPEPSQVEERRYRLKTLRKEARP